MPRRLTPIERAIEGQPGDRRKRYQERMREKGFKRVAVLTRPENVDLVRTIARLSRTLSPEDWERFNSEALAILRGGPARTERSEGAPRHREPRKARG